MAMLLLPTLWYYDTRDDDDDDDDDDEDDHRRTITKSILALPIITLVFNDSCIPSTVVLEIVIISSIASMITLNITIAATTISFSSETGSCC